MSAETLQSQIEALRKRKISLGQKNGKAGLKEYQALIESLEQMAASATEELNKARIDIEAERQGYQYLFKFVQDGYFVTDLEGVIREVNSIGAVVLGIAEDELVGQPLASHVRAKERPAFRSHLKGVNRNRHFYQWESILIHEPDGEIPVAIVVSTILDSKNNITGLRWLVRDITQHPETQERLPGNSGQLNEAQQIGHVGSWEWDIKPNEVTWSDEMYRVYGLEPQSVKVTFESFLALVHAEDEARVRSAIENSFETHQPFSFDHRVVRPDGSIRYLHSHGILLLDDEGQVVRMLGTGQDITERKQAEEQLQRLNFELEQRVESRTQELSHANERLKKVVVERARNQGSIQELNRELNRRISEMETILNVLPIGVTVAYDPQVEYITTNATGQQMLKVSRSQTTPSADHGTPTHKILRDGHEIAPEERVIYKAMRENITVRDVELEVQHADGTNLNLLAYASPFYDEQKEVRGGVVAFIDITKRKITERRLALQYAVARALAESQGISEASLKIMEVIGRETGWELGILWGFDHHANHLYVENIWQKPGLKENELTVASKELFTAPGEALSGSVFLSNESLWLPDFENIDFQRKKAALNSGYNGVVSFPLHRGEGEVLGVMEFFSSQIQPPSADLTEMFEALASQVGEFMGRTYAEQLRATQVEQQAVITKLSKRALLSTNLQGFLEEACSHILQTLSIEFCHILELIPQKNELKFRAGTGWNQEILGSPLSLQPDSQFLYVLSDNQPISIGELSKETRFQPERLFLEHEIISGMSIAISGHSTAFGLLEAYSTHPHIFTQDDMSFLQGVAHVLAAAIQHREVEEALRLSRNQLSVILSGISDGITVLNTEGQLIYANEAAARLIGYGSKEQLINNPGDRITARFKMFDEYGAPLPVNRLPGRLALQGEEALPTAIRFTVLETGEERWSMVSAQSVRNEAGKIVMSVSIFHDITDFKRSELSQHLLAETSIIMSYDLDYQKRMNKLAELLVPKFADWCAIDVLNKNKKLERVAVFHTDPQKVEWAHEMHKRFPPDPAGASGAYKVIRTGQAEYHPIIPKEAINAIPNDEQRELVQKLGLSSLIVAPLAAHGHTFGTISLIWAESESHYSPDDLTLAEEVARRAALAIDNARLYEEAQRLNAELEDRVHKRTIQLENTTARLKGEVTERKLAEEQSRQLNLVLEEKELQGEELQSSLAKTRKLYQISQTMGLANTPDDLLNALLSSTDLASVIRSSIAVFDRVWQVDGMRPASCTILTAWNKQPDTLLSIGQTMTLEEYGLMEPYSRNEPLIIPDIRYSVHVSEKMRQRLMNLNVVSSIIFPLIAMEEWYGVLSLHFDTMIALASEDVQHLQGLVNEVAMGIYNIRLLESEAQARREAEEANTLKMKFLAMVSHELRTPLTSIKGFATTLLADDVEWQPETQRDFIETINSESDKLIELIEQLLNLSRLEAGAVRITPRRVEWDQIILTSLPQLNALTINHQLVIKETESPFPLLYVDLMRISQVVTNLVANAVKYSPANTTITILAGQLSDTFIKVRVIDQGIGIPAEARTRVFEAFQQLDRDKGGTQGAGLGLSICHGLIEAHGGQIWVEDGDTGIGTTMTFTLPIAEEQRLQGPAD